MEAAGRVELTAEDSTRLMQTRKVYVPVMLGGIAVCLARKGLGGLITGGFAAMAVAEVIRVALSRR